MALHEASCLDIYISEAPAFVGPAAYGAMPPNYGVDRRAITSTYLTDYNQMAMAVPATGIPRARELSSSPTVPPAGSQPGAAGEGAAYPDGYSKCAGCSHS